MTNNSAEVLSAEPRPSEKALGDEFNRLFASANGVAQEVLRTKNRALVEVNEARREEAISRARALISCLVKQAEMIVYHLNTLVFQGKISTNEANAFFSTCRYGFPDDRSSRSAEPALYESNWLPIRLFRMNVDLLIDTTDADKANKVISEYDCQEIRGRFSQEVIEQFPKTEPVEKED